MIAAGRGIGITPRAPRPSTAATASSSGRVRDAPPIAVQLIWRRHDPHPSTHAAIALLTELYRHPS